VSLLLRDTTEIGNRNLRMCIWFIPVIPVTWKVAIRIAVQGPHGQKVIETPSQYTSKL
jgi:hypothetical protein